MRIRHFSGYLFLLAAVLGAQSVPEDPAIPVRKWAAPRQIERPKAGEAQLGVTTKELPGSLTTDSLIFVPIQPCRLADTRPGSKYTALGTIPLGALQPRTLAIPGLCGIVNGMNGGSPEAYSLSVTVVPPAGNPGGYLLVYPNPATPVPLVASFTWSPNAVYQSGAVTATASPDGSVNVVANFPTNVVVDINGYYAAPTDLGSNTALGDGALSATTSSTVGDLNTAFGYQALLTNTNGSNNTAFGAQALLTNSAASGNTAVGSSALTNATGGGNIALGYLAGSNLKAGSNNILIGNPGAASDVGTIRLGNTQTATFIAGIATTNLFGGSPVVIGASGQLGVQVTPSSRRYKEEIEDMGNASNGLLRLRPVTFRYKKANPDGQKPIQYGLIAEEVDTVYPELVVHGANGQVETVEYSKLPAMLLNELQHQYRRAERQDETIRQLEARLAAVEAAMRSTSGKETEEARVQGADHGGDVPLLKTNGGPSAEAWLVTDQESSTPDRNVITDGLQPARAAVSSNKFASAEQLARDYLRSHSESAEGYFVLGYALFKQQKAKESLAAYTEGAKYRKPSAADLEVVASDYVLLKDYPDAAKWYAKAVEWDPSNFEARYYLGRTKYSENLFEEAAADFRACLELDPHSVRAEDNLGLALEGLGRTEEAIKAYRTAIEWQADSSLKDAGPYVNLGALLASTGHAAEAVAPLEEAIRIDPKGASGHRELGKAYSRLDQTEKARQELELAVELAPKMAAQHYLLAQVYRKLGQVEKAQAETDRYRELTGTHSSDQ